MTNPEITLQVHQDAISVESIQPQCVSVRLVPLASYINRFPHQACLPKTKQNFDQSKNKGHDAVSEVVSKKFYLSTLNISRCIVEDQKSWEIKNHFEAYQA